MPIEIPTNIPDLNEQPYRGSFQQLMEANLGRNVKIDFLVGSSNLVSQTGIIHAVATQYVVLRNMMRDTYVACDNFSIKFVTFL